MRIGISTSIIQRGQTGVAQYVFNLLREFKKHTEQNEFVLFVLEEDKVLFQFVEDAMQIVTVPEKFRSPVNNILWHQTVLPKLVRKLRLDVLHIPSYRRLLWPKPCPLVATIHDLAPFHVAEKYDRMRMFYGRVVVKRLARRQDEIIAISGNTAQDITHFFGLPRKNLTVIHNGLDHDRFFQTPKEAARHVVEARHGISTPFFLYVARLEHPAKNHIRLIHAFEQFKAETKSDWKLVFGGSDWHGADAIHRAIHISPNQKDIHSLGFVSSDDLPALYRAAEVFIFPSLYEGFGLPPLEAMASGCPVITSNRGSLAEVAGSAAAIVDPEKITDITRQMIRLFREPTLREELREAGLIHAKKFNWQTTATETLKIYARAIEQFGTVASRATLKRSSPMQKVSDIAVLGK